MPPSRSASKVRIGLIHSIRKARKKQEAIESIRGGSYSITVKGESVNVGEKAFILDGEIKGTVASLAQYEVEV